MADTVNKVWLKDKDGNKVTPYVVSDNIYKADGSSFGNYVEDEFDNRVKRTGDTMSGDLTPETDGGANLGSAYKRWYDIYSSGIIYANNIKVRDDNVGNSCIQLGNNTIIKESDTGLFQFVYKNNDGSDGLCTFSALIDNVKSIIDSIGLRTGIDHLTTTNKDTIINAINEVDANADSAKAVTDKIKFGTGSVTANCSTATGGMYTCIATWTHGLGSTPQQIIFTPVISAYCSIVVQQVTSTTVTMRIMSATNFNTTMQFYYMAKMA